MQIEDGYYININILHKDSSTALPEICINQKESSFEVGIFRAVHESAEAL